MVISSVGHADRIWPVSGVVFPVAFDVQAQSSDADQVQVLEAYRMFANSSSWLRRMEEDIAKQLAEKALE